eukprot:4443114-Prymnesium_polylepis.1
MPTSRHHMHTSDIGKYLCDGSLRIGKLQATRDERQPLRDGPRNRSAEQGPRKPGRGAVKAQRLRCHALEAA